MKKAIAALFSSIMIISMGLSPTGTGAAAEKAGISVTLNGKAVSFGQEPQLANGRLLVPYRPIAEAIGANVSYDAATKTVKVTRESNIYLLPINSKTANVNGAEVALDVPATLVNGQTFVPLRFVSENLGIGVQYDQGKRSVALTASTAPAFKLFAPKQDEILHGDKVSVSLAVFNHQLADFKSHAQPKKGEGHVHIWLDSDAKDPKAAYKMTKQGSVVFDRLKPGQHTLTVQLVGNDHKPVVPEVKQVITFSTMDSAHSAAPKLTILSPAEGSTIAGNKIAVKVNVENHELADFRTHTTPKHGEGHVHLWLDTDPTNAKIAYKLTQGDTAEFDNVKAGPHTLTVQLVGNDHKPIAPEVKQVIQFTTAAADSSLKTYQVDLANYSFKPDTLTIEAGAKVIFINQDNVEHTVTADDGSFDSGLFGKGNTFEMTFAKPGVYKIHCKPHDRMVGTIVVK